MAKDKKAVLLYCDTINTVEALEDDEAGRLFKHLLRYVNDQNPTPPDKLTAIAFAPIKSQLKRDLESWEEAKTEKSDGGKLGNLKRWDVDLYNKVIAKEMSLDDAVKLAKSRKRSHTDK